MTIHSGPVPGIATALLLSMTMSAVAQGIPENAKAGEAEFSNSCASCHGGDGKGAGFLTRLFQGVDPGDLTQLAKNNGGQLPSERVSDVIDGRAEVAAHGDRKMPVWGDRYWETAMSEYGPDEFNEQRAQNRVRELVVYLEAIQE
ncbi:c-type cytochrome [Yoonia sp.]|uniref:c-type cytochrome n=1 Tax=Yoonia sp. TaxID=2212373 RepID=UPI0025E642A8|nr:c-type cytochrome [Yoonia sp.]